MYTNAHANTHTSPCSHRAMHVRFPRQAAGHHQRVLHSGETEKSGMRFPAHSAWQDYGGADELAEHCRREVHHIPIFVRPALEVSAVLLSCVLFVVVGMALRVPCLLVFALPLPCDCVLHHSEAVSRCCVSMGSVPEIRCVLTL
jgi:hypothetical protein